MSAYCSYFCLEFYEYVSELFNAILLYTLPIECEIYFYCLYYALFQVLLGVADQPIQYVTMKRSPCSYIQCVATGHLSSRGGGQHEIIRNQIGVQSAKLGQRGHSAIGKDRQALFQHYFFAVYVES